MTSEETLTNAQCCIDRIVERVRNSASCPADEIEALCSFIETERCTLSKSCCKNVVDLQQSCSETPQSAA